MNSPEIPAVIADFLLRFDQVQWSLVTAINRPTPPAPSVAAPVPPTTAIPEGRPPMLVMSLRTNSPRLSAADLMRRLVKQIGEGGGHRTKAGGFIKLETGSPTEIDRVREVLRRRYLRALKIKSSRGQRLVPKAS
jgi:hypothetical protein